MLVMQKICDTRLTAKPSAASCIDSKSARKIQILCTRTSCKHLHSTHTCVDTICMNIYMWDWGTEDDTRMLISTVHNLGDSKQGNESKQNVSPNQQKTYWFPVANVVASCLSPSHETNWRQRGVLVCAHDTVMYIRRTYTLSYVELITNVRTYAVHVRI